MQRLRNIFFCSNYPKEADFSWPQILDKGRSEWHSRLFQTTVQVKVPYKVVGLVVGPKGTTIKRIQQQTHTYIVTPSRDKDPVFEVTGLPENVAAAQKEIEAHIALRTAENSSEDADSLDLQVSIS
jgi:hypothetical protein